MYRPTIYFKYFLKMKMYYTLYNIVEMCSYILIIVKFAEPPSIMGDEAVESNLSPPVVRVVLHRKLALECPVSGTPPPNITWYKVLYLLLLEYNPNKSVTSCSLNKPRR